MIHHWLPAKEFARIIEAQRTGVQVSHSLGNVIEQREEIGKKLEKEEVARVKSMQRFILEQIKSSPTEKKKM